MKKTQAVIHAALFFLVMGAAVFASSQSFASDMDDDIESSVKDTYIFKTFLKDDSISGIATNKAEKSLVSKLANDINGVTKVINNMTLGVAVK